MSAGRPNVRLLIAATAAVLVLAGAATVALAAANGAFRHGWVAPDGQCSAPVLSGSVVDVNLINMGGPTMGGGMMGGTMRIRADRSNVTSGRVSFRVANAGSLVHELVVLPLPVGHTVGSRNVGADGRVDETGSIAEASHTCGADAGDGVNPGAISWTSVDLSPGTYELICNLAGHYTAGMYTTLIVS